MATFRKHIELFPQLTLKTQLTAMKQQAGKSTSSQLNVIPKPHKQRGAFRK